MIEAIKDINTNKICEVSNSSQSDDGINESIQRSLALMREKEEKLRFI